MATSGGVVCIRRPIQTTPLHGGVGVSWANMWSRHKILAYHGKTIVLKHSDRANFISMGIFTCQ